MQNQTGKKRRATITPEVALRLLMEIEANRPAQGPGALKRLKKLPYTQRGMKKWRSLPPEYHAQADRELRRHLLNHPDATPGTPKWAMLHAVVARHILYRLRTGHGWLLYMRRRRRYIRGLQTKAGLLPPMYPGLEGKAYFDAVKRRCAQYSVNREPTEEELKEFARLEALNSAVPVKPAKRKLLETF